MIGKLKRYTHYIVEVQIEKNNSPHRAIMYTDWCAPGDVPKGCILFNGSYDRPIERLISSLYSLKVIDEIKGMKSKGRGNMKVLNVIRTPKNLKDKNSSSYLAAIKKRAEKEGVEVRVLTDWHGSDWDEYKIEVSTISNPNTIVMEPCEFEFDRMLTLDKNLTAKAIFNLIEYYWGDEQCKPTVAILNRTDLIGNPLYKMLRDADYTPTQCHSKTSTEDLDIILRYSGVIVSATGTDLTYMFDNNHHEYFEIIDVSNDYRDKDAAKLADQTEIGNRTLDLLFEELRKVE